MAYDDTQEALAKLARDGTAPLDETVLAKSAHALLDAVFELLKQAGFMAQKNPAGQVVVPADGAYVLVAVTNDRRGLRLWVSRGAGGEKDGAPLEIEWDRVEARWVGKQIDTFLVPPPGGPRERRQPATAAVADSVIGTLRKLKTS